MNTDELDAALFWAERRVLSIQAKLHCWARDDPHRRFDDLFNLVADPAFLLVAWCRVRGNKGAKHGRGGRADGRSIEAGQGAGEFLGTLRLQLKDRSFCPLPVAGTDDSRRRAGNCAASGSPPSPTGWSRLP